MRLNIEAAADSMTFTRCRPFKLGISQDRLVGRAAPVRYRTDDGFVTC
jgi:hypothetical protein